MAVGSDDCPLIRLFGNDPDTASRLRDACRALTVGHVSSVAIHEVEGVVQVDDVTLTAVASRRNHGVIQIGPHDKFRWELTPVWWSNAAGLLDPFYLPDPKHTGFQWLDEGSGIAVIVSPNGS